MSSLGLDLSIGLSRAAGGPAPWAPSTLSGLVLDLRPTAGLFEESTLVTPTAVGGPVGGWENQGGAVDALQSTSGRRPTMRSGYVEFDGTDDGLILSGLGLGSGAQTVALTFTRRSNEISRRLLSTRSGGFWSEIALVNFSGYAEVCIRFGTATGGSGAAVGFSPALGTSEHDLEIYYDGSGPGSTGAYAVYLDGVLATLSSTGTLADSAQMGALGSYTDSTLAAPVDVKKVVAWTADHRASRTDIKAWLDAA